MDVGAALPLVGSFLVLGLVLLGTAGMVRSGTLERNGGVGIRTRATMASDPAWTAGHQAAGGALRVTGTVCLVFAVLIVALALMIPGAPSMLAVRSAAGAGYAALSTGLALAVRRANAAAQGSSTTPG